MMAPVKGEDFGRSDADHIVFPEIARQVSPLEGGNMLRPKTFAEYPGQEQVVANLKVYTQAARMRGKMLDHTLLAGPPGLGKTTLAGLIAGEMGCDLKVTSGPVIEKPADLMGVLASLESHTILFIDEIHRLPAHVEEVLYSAMDDARLDLLIGTGPTARTVRFDLKPFTLIGATTRAGSLTGPLRSRFGIFEKLDFYKPEEIARILARSASLMGAEMGPDATLALARRARGTPRIANALLSRVTDFALVGAEKVISEKTVLGSLLRLGIDEQGLTRQDREVLRVIRDRHDGGPVGLEAVAAAMNEERDTIEDVYEPYLVYRGYINRTGRGRMITQSARSHMAAVEMEHGEEF